MTRVAVCFVDGKYTLCYGYLGSESNKQTWEKNKERTMLDISGVCIDASVVCIVSSSTFGVVVVVEIQYTCV